jgi:hypothetical protein
VILANARSQLLSYLTVSFAENLATHAARTGEKFSVTVAEGMVHAASRLILATGVSDDLTTIPRLQGRWGSAFSTASTAMDTKWPDDALAYWRRHTDGWYGQVFSLLKRWLLGTHQGSVSGEHLQDYLNEFAFRSTAENRVAEANSSTAWCSRPRQSNRQLTHRLWTRPSNENSPKHNLLGVPESNGYPVPYFTEQ